MAQPVDAKAFYGYLFEADKKPTKVLDALLRGIAKHISEDVGDKDEKRLTPTKLANFYKAVGGNYDSLFVEVPHPSISWIYASIGCQHTLQPSSNDFEPPSIPALTTKGFVRWQSIEILLGPEEHVPFIQTAVRDWAIKNPDTGDAFPVDLPKEAFPLQSDNDIEKWHALCAQKLRQRATPDDDDESMRPELPPRPKVRVQEGYTHVHARPPTRVRSNTEYFDPRSKPHSSRPLSYSHVSSTGPRPVRPTISRSPTHRARQFLAPEESTSPRLARSRRRSFPENLNSAPPSPETSPKDLRVPAQAQQARRHSHPRARAGSVSSDASSEADGHTSPKNNATANTSAPRRRSHPHSSHSAHAAEEEPGSIRFAPAVPIPPDPRVRERKEREEDMKRKSYPIPIDTSGKLSAPFLLGKRDRERDRERSSRSGSRTGGNVRWKDLSEVQDLLKRGSKESSQDEEPRRSRDEYRRRDREREKPKERERLRRSSHDDPRRERDPERDRDRDRDRERDGRDHRSFRERDRERRAVSPVRGVSGRRYPSHAV